MAETYQKEGDLLVIVKEPVVVTPEPIKQSREELNELLEKVEERLLSKQLEIDGLNQEKALLQTRLGKCDELDINGFQDV